MFRENRVAKIVVPSVLVIAGCFGAAVAPDTAVPLVHMPVPVTLPTPSTSRETGAPGGSKHSSVNGTLVHPQSYGYLGGSLEAYAYFYEETVSGQVAVKAHPLGLTEPEVTLAVTDSGANDLCSQSSVPLDLYDVTHNGTNMCDKQEYTYGGDDRCLTSYAALTGKAIRVPGAFDDKGNYQKIINGKAVFSLSCMTGAVAKCAHWGYMPSDASKAEYFAACVHAARAKYVANSNDSYTCPNTLVDFVDNIGIQAQSDAKYTVEAAWGKDGLICLNSTRYQGCQDDMFPPLLPSLVPACNSSVIGWGNDAIRLWTRHKPHPDTTSTSTSSACPVNGNNCPL